MKGEFAHIGLCWDCSMFIVPIDSFPLIKNLLLNITNTEYFWSHYHEIKGEFADIGSCWDCLMFIVRIDFFPILSSKGILLAMKFFVSMDL